MPANIYNTEGPALGQVGKPQTHSGKLCNTPTYLWLQSTQLSSTICDWRACWSFI